MSAERNFYNNAAFGIGRKGHLQMRSGGDMQLNEDTHVEVSPAGLSIYANDDYDTITIVPWDNVGWLRSMLITRKSYKQGQIAAADAPLELEAD